MKHVIIRPFSTFIILTSILIGCGEDPLQEQEEGPSCVPLEAMLMLNGEYHIYLYDEAGKLKEIDHRAGPELIMRRYLIDYSGGLLTRVRLNYPPIDGVGDDAPGPMYKVNYGSDGKPTEILYYDQQSSVDPIKKVKITHDDKGRILKKESFIMDNLSNVIRYVYNESNNVSEKYRYSAIYDQEYLDTEYVEYDDKKRFFSGSPELEFVQLYIFDYDPGQNNVLHLKAYSNHFDPPNDRTFSLEYDENGYVTKLTNSLGSSDVTIIFVGMTYKCE